jgi:streptogramin lyase
MLVFACDADPAPPGTGPVETTVGSVADESAHGTETTTSTEPAVEVPSTTTSTALAPPLAVTEYETFPVPAGSRPHDVAPAPDGTVWYTAQRTGRLGRLDPATGEIVEVPLGAGSAPHGVIVGPDGAAWITDGGLDAIVRVDQDTLQVDVCPTGRTGTRLNTAAFDATGVLWFTGQAGVYGRLDTATGALDVFDARGGAGPYGIAAMPAGASVPGSVRAVPGESANVLRRLDDRSDPSDGPGDGTGNGSHASTER